MNQLNEFENNYIAWYDKKSFKIGVVIIICIIIALLFKCCTAKEVPTGVAFDTQQTQQIDSGHVALPGTNYLVVEADTRDVFIDLTNPVKNSDNGQYYTLVFTMIVDGVEVYTSEPINPGCTIGQAHIDCVIPEGQHKCEIAIQPYNIDGIATNNGMFECNLYAIKE